VHPAGYKIKRAFDLALSLLLLLALTIPCLFVALLIKLTSDGPVLYWSDRVGKGNRVFRMPKFRTMYVNTPPVATHLLQNADSHLTPCGPVLRKLSLDEVPQLWSVLRGDMSLVGPRPALYNQYDLIELRTKKRVSDLTPGITGWAQVNGRDDLPIVVKVEFDDYYRRHRSFWFDIRILLITVLKAFKAEGVRH
jgi:O-antigen biosynthesis protein WbqP